MIIGKIGREKRKNHVHTHTSVELYENFPSSNIYLESPFGWHACKIAGRASSSNAITVLTPAFRTITSIDK